MCQRISVSTQLSVTQLSVTQLSVTRRERIETVRSRIGNLIPFPLPPPIRILYTLLCTATESEARRIGASVPNRTQLFQMEHHPNRW